MHVRERGPEIAGFAAGCLGFPQLAVIFDAADRKLSESIVEEAALSRCEQIVPGRSFLPKRRSARGAGPVR